MNRFYSIFPDGSAGAGLLALRAALVPVLLLPLFGGLSVRLSLGAAALLLLLGLLTRVASISIGIVALSAALWRLETRGLRLHPFDLPSFKTQMETEGMPLGKAEHAFLSLAKGLHRTAAAASGSLAEAEAEHGEITEEEMAAAARRARERAVVVRGASVRQPGVA